MYSQAVIEEYKRIRIPHVSRYAGTGKIYHHEVTAIQAIKSAIYIEKVNRLWAKYEDDLVRLKVEPDYDCDLEFLLGDMYNPEVNTDINPTTLKRQEKEEIDRINREGVYGIISQVKCKCCGNWEDADSCWGFVGDDWKDSGNDLDIKVAALDKAGVWND